MTQASAELLAVLFSVGSIGGLWILVFWTYRDYRVDRFRQEMFTLRDELFDQAAAGRFQFNDPAYGMLRSTMNGFIRFGHRLNLLQLAAALAIGQSEDYRRTQPRSFAEGWSRATADLTPDARARLDKNLARMNELVVSHIIRSSPLFLISVIPPLAFWLTARWSVDHLLSLFRGPIDDVDSAAMAYGKI